MTRGKNSFWQGIYVGKIKINFRGTNFYIMDRRKFLKSFSILGATYKL